MSDLFPTSNPEQIAQRAERENAAFGLQAVLSNPRDVAQVVAALDRLSVALTEENNTVNRQTEVMIENTRLVGEGNRIIADHTKAIHLWVDLERSRAGRSPFEE